MHGPAARHARGVHDTIEAAGLGDDGGDRVGHGVTVHDVGLDVVERRRNEPRRRLGRQVDAHHGGALGE